ncbi:AAA family ATPase [Pseudoclavibacter chungangensis]|uniref:AAA family ATPase n=1 Tax=Pseudoclavibacter chungangensis TaxID=587635 RepID=A0A7J5BPE4_9MICO|nr:ATP-binding protein [Pseudoclavibacter chungangensis]KAB1654836.1 AAA family ATPase [Pseudoclavibacter chungangensis]NYJ68041.1 DNA repair exonuclease SbcCD ATPase subunit [Pseudoclavibacter chungangensis]
MRFVRITLRDFRGVTDSTITFGEGVTVVAGPNEVGKSSVAEAIRLLRRFKSSSRRQDIVDVQPLGRDTGPFVELELRTGPYHLVYRKRWLRSPLTELEVRTPHEKPRSGDEAHERFNAILAETVDLDLLDALDVVQGTSLERPDLARVSALHRALDDTSGAFDGHDELVARVDTEFEQYFTPTGKPGVRFARILAARDEAVRTVEALEADSAELDRLVEEHARASGLLDDLAVRLAAAKADAAELDERSSAIDELERQAERSAAGVTDAERVRDAAVSARDDRRLLRDELAERGERLTELGEQVELLDEARARAEQALGAAGDERARLEDELTSAVDEADEAATHLRLQRERAEHEELGARVARAHELDASRRAAAARTNEATVDDEALERLVELETVLRVAESARAAATARVVVEPIGTRSVTVDGRRIRGGEPFEAEVHDTLRVELAEVLTVEVHPGTPPAELERAVTAARGARADALRELDVDSVDSARRVAEHRRRSEAEQRRLAGELTAVLRGNDLNDLEERLAVLEARRPASAVEDAGPTAHATAIALLETAADEARTRADEARSAVDRVREAVDAKRTTADGAREAWVRGSEALRNGEGERDRIAERLDRARLERDDEALDAEVDAAERVLGERREQLATDRAALDAADAETLRIRRTNAHELVTSTTNDLAKTRSTVDRLASLVDDRAASGIYDRMTDARAALDAATETAERTERAATAVKTLREALRRHRDEAQQKYVAPFTERIERLGRVVFGSDFAVTVSPELVIESRTLAGRTVPFESLSAGAREQLALLGRLACAQLVDPGEGAPVVLDDTLGFADPERLRSLGAVLGDVGRTAQVVLLTCQPSRFDGLGGAEIVRLPQP